MSRPASTSSQPDSLASLSASLTDLANTLKHSRSPFGVTPSSATHTTAWPTMTDTLDQEDGHAAQSEANRVETQSIKKRSKRGVKEAMKLLHSINGEFEMYQDVGRLDISTLIGQLAGNFQPGETFELRLWPPIQQKKHQTQQTKQVQSTRPPWTVESGFKGATKTPPFPFPPCARYTLRTFYDEAMSELPFWGVLRISEGTEGVKQGYTITFNKLRRPDGIQISIANNNK